MNRKLLSICALVGVGMAIGAFYFLSAGSPEEKRDRYLKEGREYIAQSKINEAVIMFKNAVQVDPASADSHHELGLALLRKADYRGGFGEFRRAADLKPEIVQARYYLGNLYALSHGKPRQDRREIDPCQEDRPEKRGTNTRIRELLIWDPPI